MTRFTINWKVDHSGTGKNVKEFLKEKMISRSALTDIKFNGGFIAVNGEEVNVRYVLKKDDVLVIQFPNEVPSQGVSAENIPLNIIYEDEYILVINKDAGMSSIPSREHPQGSLANALMGYYKQIGLHATIHIVTRLDRDTSGLVLVAKHRHIHHLLSEQQKTGRVSRTYEAFAEGQMSKSRGCIEEPIGRKSDSIIEREVRSDGQYALTNYRVIKVLPKFTWVELQLGTGRTHQIRVHLSFLGHPLLGDDLYGGKRGQMNRQALHCKKLTFNHPISNHRLEFVSDLPEDMNHLL
jgi:23S rRNA pseudouridine1911/1915/1917 synthase